MKPKEVARRSATASWAAALLFAICLPASSALAVEGSCSNEARRAEQSSTYLPNCRAYEQVTPVAKDSGEPAGVQVGLSEREAFRPIEGALAAVDGDRMAWVSEYAGLAGSSASGLGYLSTRGTEGWSTEATVPSQSPENGVLCPYLDGIVGWSGNLTAGILADGDGQEWGDREEAFVNQADGCGHAEPALREADGTEIKEPRGFQNLFLRNNEAGFYQLVNVTPGTAPQPTPNAATESEQEYFPSSYVAGSSTLSHVVFEDELPLTEEAEHLTKEGQPQTELETACKEDPKGRACWEGHDDLYVWSEGRQPSVRLVTVLPNGDAVEGTLAGSTRNTGAIGSPTNVSDYRHAVSASGSRIFFEAEGSLYVRENGGEPQSALGTTGECTEPTRACTVQLDLSQGGSGTGGGKWLAASEDGARVFFTDEQDLTENATATSGAPDLYEYDFEAEEDKRLTDLTADAMEPADVLGLSGASEDGSYVYFVAQGDLTGVQQNSQGVTAVKSTAGTGNLVGPAEAHAEWAEGSTKVIVSEVNDEFHVGQEVEANGIPAGSTVAVCLPSCASPTELTLSKAATTTGEGYLTGLGGYEVSDVTTNSGAFEVGMTITGSGIPANTSITAVGSETLTLSKRASESGAEALSATGANLYMSHDGATKFIATLNGEDLCDWTSNTGCNLEEPSNPRITGLTARVSGNGRYLAFNSVNRLTGYVNTDTVTKKSDEEIFLYEVEGNHIACVSCNPNKPPAAGGADIDWPALPDKDGQIKNAYPQRNVSESGQVFFETAEKLLPKQDVNGLRDVYEYEHGTLSLISSGTSSAPSYFLEASPSGDDVFFVTAQKLLTRDTESTYNIYDARVGGGFPEPATSPRSCESESECKGSTSTSQTFSPLSSTTFAGSGNVTQAKKLTKTKVKRSVKRKRKAKLRRELQACKGADRHSKRKRVQCERRARKSTLRKKAGTSPSHGQGGRQ